MAPKPHIAEDDPRLSFVPFDVAATPPPGLIDHHKDRWWIVHPEKGILYWTKNKGRDRFPQCNSHKSIAEIWLKMFPWAEIRFMPSVFNKINPHDYCC